MITPADTPPSAPEQMPASSFSITAPDPGASSAPPSTIHTLDKSMNSASDIGTLMNMPAPTDFSVATAHLIGYHGEVNE